MTEFKTHTLDNAPDAARETLEGVRKAYGFIPNLIATMAESPALAKAYVAIGNIFGETTFDAAEKQVVLLTVSRFNECEYCVAAHTAVAAQAGVGDDIVTAIRNDQPIADAKLETLRQFARRVMETRGWPEDADLERFFDAGYGREQVLEVVLGIAMKTLSNYTNHIAETDLDEAFGSARWSAPDTEAA